MLGRTLGHYSIVSELGAGGIGVVYEAVDTKLGRSVAIKRIRDELASDESWRMRFEREARVLASLNHPNIATIHGLEEVDSVRFLVMELVPGATLAERLAQGPLTVQEALRVFRQVAEALKAAHEKGIVHRDLKPSNIKLTPEGRVKVLDFGLAKAVGELSGAVFEGAPTVTKTTGAGAILGTVAYMSPEQARGQPVDRRADIWAFGATLYESLTGRPAFAGATLSDTLARVIEREPDWEALPKSTPRSVRVLLRRCLRKEVEERLCDIGDARIELEETLSGRDIELGAGEARPTVGRRTLAAALTIGLGVGALAAWAVALRAQRQTLPERAVARFEFALPEGRRLPVNFDPQLAISPDGGQMVYTGFMPGTRQVYRRRLDEVEVQAVPGTEEGAFPLFSPDGRWLGFVDINSGWHKKVDPSGGVAARLVNVEENTFGQAWSPDESLVHGGFGLTRVPFSGAAAETLLELDTAAGERYYRDPSFLPGGDALLFTISMDATESHDDAKIAVLDLRTKRKTVLIEGGFGARYAPSGHIIYARGGSLLAVPFDLEKLEVTGEPFKALDGVYMSVTSGMAVFDIARNGTLVYAPGSAEGAKRRVVFVDRRGKAESLPLPEGNYLHPRLSPDERQLALEVEGPAHDIFSYEFERGTFTKLTFDGASHWPLWTPRGDRLTFRSGLAGSMTMWWMPADRSAPPERLTEIGKWQSGVSWAPDGKALAFISDESFETAPDVYVLPLDSERKPQPFAQSKFAEGSPKFSPDGRWVAYCSNESGRPEIYVQPWPGPGPKIQISTDGGTDPLWSRRTGELFYRNGDKMMAVKVTTAPSFTVSRPQLLWEGHYFHGRGASCGWPGPTSSNYDVTANAERFVVIEDRDQDIPPITRLRVVLNFTEELKRLERDRKES